MNPLIDYGSIDGDRRFEAYEARAPIALSRAAASRAIAHAFRFLRAHGIAVARADTDFVLRPIEAGRSAGPRTLGVILQHRQALAVLVDTLDTSSPAGASVVSIQGAPQSGLRTTRVLVARAARLHGYVPVAISVVDRFASLPDQVAGRHVCVFGTVEWTRGVSIASLLTRLSTEGARRHVVLLFDRPGIQATPGTVTLERMGVTAMSGMVFVDSEQGPKPGEVFAAARAADGRPGNCLERLGAGTTATSPLDRSTSPCTNCRSPTTHDCRPPRRQSRTSRSAARVESPDEPSREVKHSSRVDVMRLPSASFHAPCVSITAAEQPTTRC